MKDFIEMVIYTIRCIIYYFVVCTLLCGIAGILIGLAWRYNTVLGVIVMIICLSFLAYLYVKEE